MIHVPIKIFSKSGVVPSYAYEGDSGFDINAYLPGGNIGIYTGEIVVIPTGLYGEIPFGWEIQVRPRSSLSRRGITCAFGSVDGTYRGEWGIIITNNTQERITISDGQKIAQGVIAPVYVAQFQRVTKQEDLGSTERGNGGFGSTGA